jgi:hypothetical protein
VYVFILTCAGKVHTEWKGVCGIKEKVRGLRNKYVKGTKVLSGWAMF